MPFLKFEASRVRYNSKNKPLKSNKSKIPVSNLLNEAPFPLILFCKVPHTYNIKMPTEDEVLRIRSKLEKMISSNTTVSVSYVFAS